MSEPLLEVFREPRLEAREPRLLPDDTDRVLAERLREDEHTLETLKLHREPRRSPCRLPQTTARPRTSSVARQRGLPLHHVVPGSFMNVFNLHL